MVSLQLVILFGAAVATLSSDEFQSECDPKRPSAKKEGLDDKMKFPESYKVTGVITDWLKKSATAVLEVARDDKVSTLISDRGSSLHWISLKSEAKVFLHNQTSGKCGDASSTAPLSAFNPLSTITKNLSSLSTLVAGLLDFSKTSQGELRGSSIVAGVEGIHWVSCVSGTNGSANLQVEVVFGGVSDQSVKPPSPAFDNPLLLFMQVTEYGNFSDKSTRKSLMSVEFDSYNLVAAEDAHLFSTPSGTVCDGWKEVPIPLNVTEPFSALVQLVDEKNVESQSSIYYSASDEMVIVSGARRGEVVPFINEKNVPEGATTVVHDFAKGYEYSLDSARCVRLSAIPSDSLDVDSSGGVVGMRPVAQVLIAPDLKFGNYGQVTSSNGRIMEVYRGTDSKTNEIVEVHLDGDQLASYTTFKLVNGTPSMSSHMRFMRAPADVVPLFVERIRGCFSQSASALSENNTFSFEVKSRSVKDVYTQGVETITSALASALAKIAPINPFRVHAFYGTGLGKSLRIFFSVDEKTEVKPATVPKYNYTAEVSSSEVLEKLNATISQGDWKFPVLTSEKKQEDWIVVAKSLDRYAPTSSIPVPSYMGYTGGAMFVLGVFSLLLGVAIGAGGVFFVTKRQRISTLAYQVFE